MHSGLVVDFGMPTNRHRRTWIWIGLVSRQWIASQLIGRNNCAMRRRLRIASKRAERTASQLARAHGPLTAVKAGQLRSEMLMKQTAESAERASRPFWMLPDRLVVVVLLLLSAVVLVGLIAAAPQIDARLDVRSERFVCKFRETDAQTSDPILLSFDQVESSWVSLGGMVSVPEYDDDSGEAWPPDIEVGGRSCTDVFVVSDLQIPRRATLDVQVLNDQLKVRISLATRREDAQASNPITNPENVSIQVELAKKAPRPPGASGKTNGELDSRESSEFGLKDVGDAWVAVQHPGAEAVEITIRFAPASLPRYVDLDLVGRDLEIFELCSLKDAGRGVIPDSFLIDGLLSFPKHEISTRELSWQEIVSLSSQDGRIDEGQL